MNTGDSGVDLHELCLDNDGSQSSMSDLVNSPQNNGFGYEPPISLWSIVEQHVPVHERDEIKSMLGESLVEQSLELHEEVNTLLDIWREMREEKTSHPTNSLPEPPGVRSRLCQEILFFVENIRDKNKKLGRDLSLDFHDREIINYACTPRSGTSDQFSRPSTARSSRDGRETPWRATPTSDRFSMNSSISDEVEGMTEKLNILRLDEVSQHLKEYLEGEVSQLLSDVTFLQNCLEDEVHSNPCSPMSREPTIGELKEERSKLEKDLLSERQSPVTLSMAMDSPVRALPDDLKKLRPNRAKPKPSGSIPLKAVHNLKPVVPDKMKEPERTQVLKTETHVPDVSTRLKPTRVSSADRFRRMVSDWRDPS